MFKHPAVYNPTDFCYAS